MSSWWTEYSQESANYLEDNTQLVAHLYFALEALDDKAVPGELEVRPGLHIAIIEGHVVAFARDITRKIIRIMSIKPPAG